MKRIAALVPNKLDVSPGQRIRIETWSKHLAGYGWQVDFYPFEDEHLHDVFYKTGNHLDKARQMIACYARQFRNVVRKIECDGLFVYREAALVGPALLERMAKRRGVPMIYDIDDPIFLPYKSPVNGWLSLLKFSRKTHTLFRMSDRVISINSLIGDYARRYNDAVSVVPNFVDTDVYTPGEKNGGGGEESGTDEPPKIVWTGSVSTLQNLTTIAEPLRRLQAEYNVPVRIIANGETEIEGLKLDCRRWSPEAEISNLQASDIGIVPLLDLEWNPWKFYLKTVQYLAAGLPVVARNVGSNGEVIRDGENGFLVETEREWYERLKLLIENRDLRRRMGEAARRTAVEKFSVRAQMPRVAEIFGQVYGGHNN